MSPVSTPRTNQRVRCWVVPCKPTRCTFDLRLAGEDVVVADVGKHGQQVGAEGRRRRPRGTVVDPHAREAIRLQLEAAHVVRTVFRRGIDRLAESVETAVEILDVMADLVADEEGDAGLGLRPELGHQSIGRRGADEHGLIAAAVGRPVPRIEPVAVGRREARHELHIDGRHLHSAALHQPAPGGDRIFARTGDNGAQPKLGRRDAAIGIERIGGHLKGAWGTCGSIASRREN